VKKIISLVPLALVLAILFILVLAYSGVAKTITDVEIQGTIRTDKATILSAIKSKPGSKFSLRVVDDDIKDIYKLGFYKTIKAELSQEGNENILTYIVLEKPSVRFITFRGNDEISDKKLQKALQIKPYNVLNKDLINKTINQIMGMYASKGMYLTRVNYKIKKAPQNRVDIEFDIKESRKTRVEDINIIGNKHIRSDKLKDKLSNHVKNGPYILTFLPWFYSGKLKINELDSDSQKIRDIYLSKGYLDVLLRDPIVTVEPDTGDIHIDFSLKEGKQYILKSLSFKNIAPFNKKELLENMNLSLNKPFNIVALRHDIEKITDMYADRGYAFADVNPEITKDKNNAYLTLVVDKGVKVYIKRIEIVGNTKTHDNVIRRELKIKEGDLYSLSKINRSKIKIMRLDYFDNVKITTKRLSDNTVDMKVIVKEKPTGMLSFGVGYSSYDKIGVQGSVAERNLFGTGVYGKLSANLSSKSSLFDLHLVDDWLYNRPISAGLDIMHQKYENYDYTQKTTGFTVSVAKRFWDDDLTIGTKYSLTFDNIELATDNPGYYLKQQEGKHTESAIEPFITYDTLDSSILPTRGFRITNSFRVAGLGGDRKYIKDVLFGEYFHPIPFGLIGHIRAEIGYAKGLSGEDVPINRRFFLGGIDSMRGFKTDKLSPQDDEGNYIGGNREFQASGEIIFPLISDLKLYGVGFYDIGNNWLDKFDFASLRSDAGVGIRWISPLGPIRVEVGKNLSPKNDEKSTVFQFSVGALF
jgi:outer membrane protein insertion porin family